MRYILGQKEDYIELDLHCGTRFIKFKTQVFAHYCANCGTESVGVVIKADETLSYSEVNERFGDYAKKRRSELARASKVSQEMLHTALESKCPMCGKSFPEKSEKGFFEYVDDFQPYENNSMFFAFNADEIFEKMETERQETTKKEAQNIVAKVTEKANDNNHKADALVSRTAEIAASTQTLLSYIGHLMRLEVGLYAVQQNLVELYNGKSELRLTLLKENADKLEKNKEKVDNAKDKLTKFEKNHDSFVSVAEPKIVYPPEPQKPSKPRFTEALPQQPVYKTAGMFNKKKIAAENEAMKNAYEAELERYKQREAAFQSDLENYKVALQQYEAAYEAWKAEVDSLKKKAQSEQKNLADKKEAEYNNIVSTLKDLVQKAENEFNQALSNIVSDDNQAGMQLFAEEISEGEKLLESIIAARNELYSYNVIYPKYRNLIALSSFYDYLMAGRCNALAGTDGAYNLYESESRADLIITKLSDVLTSLDRIQENQYMLYQQMSEVNNGVQSLNESMTSVVSSLAKLKMTGEEMKNSLKSISSDTASMNKEVKSIAENAEITAHYSKVSAFYAKKNAELTDALGYMTAFK